MDKRIPLGIGAGLAVAGAVIAGAATLGTITTASIGANTAVISSCDTDGVTMTYTPAYNAAGDYRISGVNVTGINTACNGDAIRVQLNNSGTAVGSEATGTVATGAFAGTFTTPGQANPINAVAVVIIG